MSLNLPTAHRGAIAIRARHLTKSYKLYPSSRARVSEALSLRGRRLHKELRAIDDLSIDIPSGATIGILGVNGSGKSTLLQMICSIIEPSDGEIEVNGRVAALIELGAGFNPHLSGRENVAINGVIMGLTRREIDARMPSIDEFAEIGEFFDQPVRTYSSGMFMRVAFAMAIHVDPDILVIDEALSVGDARFQQKCFRRFRDFQEHGNTILLVTHDRFSVTRLCTHGAVLHRGKLVHFGDPKVAVECYSQILMTGDAGPLPHASPVASPGAAEAEEPPGDRLPPAAQGIAEGSERIAGFIRDRTTEDRCHLRPSYNPNERRTNGGGGRIVDYLIAIGDRIDPPYATSGETMSLFVRVHFAEDCPTPIIGFAITSKDGVLIFSTNSLWMGQTPEPRSAGDVAVYRFEVLLNLGANDWFVDLAVARSQAEIVDAREALLHLRCDPKLVSHGLASLATVFEECSTARPAG